MEFGAEQLLEARKSLERHRLRHLDGQGGHEGTGSQQMQAALLVWPPPWPEMVWKVFLPGEVSAL